MTSASTVTSPRPVEAGPDLLVVETRGSARSLLVHVVIASALVVGAIVTFDPAAPMHRLSFWLVLLALTIPFAIGTFRSIHRDVVLDRSKKQVIMTTRPWVFAQVTERYDVASLTGVRSFVDRNQVKAPWMNHLELVAPESQRGLLVSSRGAGIDETEHPAITALRRRLSTEAWFDDVGYVGKGSKMPRQVRAGT